MWKIIFMTQRAIKMSFSHLVEITRVKTHFGTLWSVTITSTFDLKFDKSSDDTTISVNVNLIPTEFDK